MKERERRERNERRKRRAGCCCAIYMYMFRLGGLNFVASGWITTRSNRIADRLIGTVAVSWFPEAKRSISRSGETRWTRATRCTIHGGKNKIWNGVCFNFQDRTCWLDLRFDSRQWLRLDIIVRFNFQRVTPSNYDRYIGRENGKPDTCVTSVFAYIALENLLKLFSENTLLYSHEHAISGIWDSLRSSDVNMNSNLKRI